MGNFFGNIDRGTRTGPEIRYAVRLTVIGHPAERRVYSDLSSWTQDIPGCSRRSD